MIDVDNYHGDTYRLCSTRIKPAEGMGNLSRDACAALEAGMSYGKWKAMHPKQQGGFSGVAKKIRQKEESSLEG